jgi:hypothetical protein
MIGIVLLTNPVDGGFSFDVVFGIGGAMAGAALSILLRRLGKADNPFSLALWYNGTGGILLTMLALTVGVPMIVPDQTVMVTACPAGRCRFRAAAVHHDRLQIFRSRCRGIASLYADTAGSACRLPGAWRDCHPFRSGRRRCRDRQLPVHCLARNEALASRNLAPRHLLTPYPEAVTQMLPSRPVLRTRLAGPREIPVAMSEPNSG